MALRCPVFIFWLKAQFSSERNLKNNSIISIGGSRGVPHLFIKENKTLMLTYMACSETSLLQDQQVFFL